MEVFVTEKEHPKNFDGCWEAAGVDVDTPRIQEVADLLGIHESVKLEISEP